MVAYKLVSARGQAPLEQEPFHQWTLTGGAVWTAFHRTSSGYLLRFPGLADFTVSAKGHSVVCYPLPYVSENTSQHLYLNQVLPLALSLQGKLVFHGSAVEVGDVAVAFIATSGKGKSTMAAGFACNGYRFLADDGLVVEPCDIGYQAMPSHPSIRLWNDSGIALCAPSAQTAPALPFTPKSRFMAGSDIAFCDQPRPLHHVYFLGAGNTTEVVIEAMTAAESLVEWIQHSFLLDIHEHSMLASHFDMVARLSKQLMHFRLDYPRRFKKLVYIRRLIVEHISRGNHVQCR